MRVQYLDMQQAPRHWFRSAVLVVLLAVTVFFAALVLTARYVASI